MKKVLIVGAGNIGAMIGSLLKSSGDYQVRVADHDPRALAKVSKLGDLRTLELDATDQARLVQALTGCYAVISAAPYSVTRHIARAAKSARVHYLDLTEDVAMTKEVIALAQDADTAFIPQCGLAPGFVSIVGYDLAQRFDRLDALRLRVGALPQFPSNSLAYNLTWSTEGVINEYCQPCEAIVNGELTRVPALEQVERFALDGIAYEAFNTSGGLGTLCETLAGQVRQLNYRSIRYPGHRDIMKTLIHDLRLGERRELFKEVLENAVPTTMQDVVVIFVTASGWRDDRLTQESYANKIYPREISGRTWAGIQITTGSAVCAVLDLLRTGELRSEGFIRQEQIPLQRFLANRFGQAYRLGEPHTAVPLAATEEAA